MLAGASQPRMTEVFQSATRDPGAARDWLNQRYARHDIRITGDGQDFDFLHISAPLKEGSANFLRYHAEVEILPGAFPDFFMLEMPLEGGVTVHLDGIGEVRSSTEGALFLPPNRPLASLWRPNTLQFMLKLNARDVQRRWQELTGRPGTSLAVAAPEIEFRSTEGWRLQQTMLLLKAEFERGLQLGKSSLAASPLSAAVIDSVLTYLIARDGGSVQPERHQLLPATLRRCLKHFSSHLAEDMALADLVALTGVSERSLFNQFQDFLGTTPMRYLELKRLEAARGRLLTGAVSVSDAARSVGLRHLGRFSQRYFEVYGEKPSETRAIGTAGRLSENRIDYPASEGISGKLG